MVSSTSTQSFVITRNRYDCTATHLSTHLLLRNMENINSDQSMLSLVVAAWRQQRFCDVRHESLLYSVLCVCDERVVLSAIVCDVGWNQFVTFCATVVDLQSNVRSGTFVPRNATEDLELFWFAFDFQLKRLLHLVHTIPVDVERKRLNNLVGIDVCSLTPAKE